MHEKKQFLNIALKRKLIKGKQNTELNRMDNIPSDIESVPFY